MQGPVLPAPAPRGMTLLIGAVLALLAFVAVHIANKNDSFALCVVAVILFVVGAALAGSWGHG